MEFARLLRRVGLQVGPADLLTAMHAVSHTGGASRTEVRAALGATLAHRHEQAVLFDGAFELFWRDLTAAQHDAAMSLPESAPPRAAPGDRRMAEAQGSQHREHRGQPQRDVTLAVSDAEQLQAMDFEAMSAAQVAGARAEIAKLRLPLDLRCIRRTRPAARGLRIDMAATLRAASRHGGELLHLVRAERVVRPPPLVVLCDISGSMGRYAHILLHFLHAVANDRDRVSVFLFGTRLTNVTRQLRHRDPEAALAAVAGLVPDWSGGTRIGDTLAQFNRHWAKRVLGQGAVVLLVTDGLDRAGADGLAPAMERLHKSCRRLIWLNPLLRWDGFEPKSQGIRAMLPHVDEFRPVHNIASLRALIAALSRPAPARGRPLGPVRDRTMGVAA